MATLSPPVARTGFRTRASVCPTVSPIALHESSPLPAIKRAVQGCDKRNMAATAVRFTCNRPENASRPISSLLPIWPGLGNNEHSGCPRPQHPAAEPRVQQGRAGSRERHMISNAHHELLFVSKGTVTGRPRQQNDVPAAAAADTTRPPIAPPRATVRAACSPARGAPCQWHGGCRCRRASRPAG